MTLFLALFISAEAKDSGSHGTCYPVEEEDVREAMKLKETPRLNASFRPEPVSGLLSASETRSFYFDPTVEMGKEVKDLEGRVIVRRGERINPLETVSLSEELLFFDGGNPLHIAWAKEQKGRWILVAGSPSELEESEERPVYFDQLGVLTERLGLQRIPCRVSQEGLLLKIEEFATEEDA